MNSTNEWFVNILHKIFALFDGKEDLSNEEENKLLVSVADNDEERDAISQICEEIDLTHSTYIEAEASGEEPESYCKKLMVKDDENSDDSITASEINHEIENAVESEAENVAEIISETDELK